MERIVFSYPAGQGGRSTECGLRYCLRTEEPAVGLGVTSRIEISHNLILWNDLDVLQNGKFAGRGKGRSDAGWQVDRRVVAQGRILSSGSGSVSRAPWSGSAQSPTGVPLKKSSLTEGVAQAPEFRPG